MSKSENNYICVYSKQTYKGKCKVTNCPANLCSVEKHKSSCFFNVIKKKSFGSGEISYAFGLKLNKTKYRIKSEQKYLKRVIVYSKLLPQIRSVKSKYNFCSKCGLFYLKRKKDCKIKEKCTLRSDHIETILNENKFTLNEITLTKEDIWLILAKEELVHQFGITVSDLLNCNTKLYNTLKTYINNKLNHYDKTKI